MTIETDTRLAMAFARLRDTMGWLPHKVCNACQMENVGSAYLNTCDDGSLLLRVVIGYRHYYTPFRTWNTPEEATTAMQDMMAVLDQYTSEMETTRRERATP